MSSAVNENSTTNTINTTNTSARPAYSGNRPLFKRKPKTFQKKDRPEDGQMLVLGMRRVTKVGEGAKRFSFSVSVVVGDTKGHVGIGTGKGRDVSTAIAKATTIARKQQIQVYLPSGTVPYYVMGKFCKSQVMLRRARSGTGLRAGKIVRSICSCLGVQDIVTKTIGNNNFLNVAKATMDALNEYSKVRHIPSMQITNDIITTTATDSTPSTPSL